MFNNKQFAGLVAGVALATLSTGALASGTGHVCPQPSMCEPHFYVGAGLGYGDLHWDNTNVAGASYRDGTFVPNVYAGYALNDYAAIQGGFTYFTDGRISVAGANTNVRTYALDLVGRINVPVPMADGFKLFAVAGVSYLNSRFSNTNPGGNQTRSHFGVTYGAGGSYRVMDNVDIVAKWQRFAGNGRFGTDYQPFADSFTVGGEYHFS